MFTKFIIAKTIENFCNTLESSLNLSIEKDKLGSPISVYNRNRDFRTHISRQRFINSEYNKVFKGTNLKTSDTKPWYKISWDRGNLRRHDSIQTLRNGQTRITVDGKVRHLKMSLVILPITIIVFSNQVKNLDILEEYFCVCHDTANVITTTDLKVNNEVVVPELNVKVERVEVSDRGHADIDSLGTISAISFEFEVSFMLPVFDPEIVKLIHQINFRTYVSTPFGDILDNEFIIPDS